MHHPVLTFFPAEALSLLREDQNLAVVLDQLDSANHSGEWRITAVPPDQYFRHLARAIVFQQLSGKAASTIFDRLTALLPKDQLTPEAVLSLSHEMLRTAGLSAAKARYLHALAEAVHNGHLDFPQFPSMSDEQIICQLTSIKGIGRWTAEMFLLFAMGREDVFSYADLGLRKGFQRAYALANLPSAIQMRPIVEKWSPYKTYASVALWANLELGQVEKS